METQLEKDLFVRKWSYDNGQLVETFKGKSLLKPDTLRLYYDVLPKEFGEIKISIFMNKLSLDFIKYNETILA